MAITTSIIWDDIISKSDKELIDELALAKQNGLISQFTGIKLYLDLDDESTQEEMERIKSETPIIETPII